MFAKKQPMQLRTRLAEVYVDILFAFHLICFSWNRQIERDVKFNKLSKDEFVLQKIEILIALKKLKENLDVNDEQFLKTHGNESLKEFEKVSNELRANENIIKTASSELRNIRD
ncbi:protein LZIC-like protein [Leptotrombidium deliense]|uniref:Protein LZIC-like protein n=1 Tax=Leptotrombidium deliense TaxID=299467 RepID=A0A443SAZ5_9ACAR|nr:protein LZIC-like protein [Leptotrombidium deliense]